MYAQTSDLPKDTKTGTEFYFRRNNMYINPIEIKMFNALFSSATKDDENRNIFNTIGYKKKIGDSKFQFEANFFETRKGNLNTKVFTCDRRSCYNYPYDSGTYYRTQSNLLVNYRYIENRVHFILGLTHLRSELTKNDPNYYNYQFGQNYLGPKIGVHLETPRFVGLYLSFELSVYYLYGRVKNTYSNVISANRFDYFQYSANPNSKFLGKEITAAIGYELNDSVYFTVSVYGQDGKSLPNSTDVYTNPHSSNYYYSSRFKYADKVDSMWGYFVQVGIRL